MNKTLMGLWFGCSSAFSTPFTNAYYVKALEPLSNMSDEQKQLVEQAPDLYQFTSRFIPGKSSVSYGGQSFRQVLISDLYSFMSQLNRGGYEGLAEDAYLAMDSFYSYDSQSELVVPGSIWGYATFGVGALGLDGATRPIFEGEYYEDIQSKGKQLRNKTAGNDNPLRRGELKGWSNPVVHGVHLSRQDRDNDGIIEPEDLLDTWFKVCAAKSSDSNPFLADLGNGRYQQVHQACVTEDGLDLSQLVQKFLHGAVSYSQAAGDYLSVALGPTKGLNADNSRAIAGAVYTAREHHWDEAFGYFGAARDYLLYDLKDIQAGYSRDTNKDGAIAILAEKNQGISINAAKRTLGAKEQDVNFVFEAGDAFIKGRYLMSQTDGDPTLVRAQAMRALGAWEKTLAASTIHYINKTISEMQSYGSPYYLFTNHAKYWSEMKGFGLAFQFSPVSILSDEGFDKLHLLLGDRPVLGSAGEAAVDAYVGKLLEARHLLRLAFSFSPTTTANW